MSKVEIIDCGNGLFLSKCGRAFKEHKYFKRGGKHKKYAAITVNKERFDIHRLVATNFLENPDNSPWVLHNDDDQTNNHVDNLRWGTPLDNSKDAIKNGCFTKYQTRRKQYKADLRATIVNYLRSGYTHREMCKEIPVSESRISQIVKEIRLAGIKT
jgi:hypothetical protein